MKVFANLVEKVVLTFVEAFVAFLLMGGLLDVDAAQAAAMAGIAAALTAFANSLPVVPAGQPFYVDLLFRTIRTYLATFIGILVSVPVFSLDTGALQAAAIGALPAALTVVKGLVARKVGDPDTAALLPADSDLGW